MKPFIWFVLAAVPLALHAQVAPKLVKAPFTDWSAYGATNLFAPDATGVAMTWDSSKPNSYFYLPLGLTLSRRDDFQVEVIGRLDTLELGTTPGRPYTFQVAWGLINLNNATAPELFRGSGINPEHGARNLIEFDYFPESGFIAPTLAPTIATQENEILFSSNHPAELSLGEFYKIRMRFTAPDQTLRTALWIGETDGTNVVFESTAFELKPLVLSSNYSDFGVDALALISYSDEGQSPPQFAGSITATGIFHDAQVIVYNRPSVRIEQNGGPLEISFDTTAGWRYQLEFSINLHIWQPIGQPIDGTNTSARLEIKERAHPSQFYRVKGERM